MLTTIVKTLTRQRCKFPDMETDTLSELAQFARVRANFKGPDDAARAIGCSRTLVISWENGGGRLKGSKYLLDAARAYKVFPNWLATGEGPDGYPVESDDAWTAGPVHIRTVSPRGEIDKYLRQKGSERVQVMGVAVVDAQGSFDQVTEDPEGNGYFLLESVEEGSYFLRLRGPGSTHFTKPGWYILLSPYHDPQPDEEVVVRFEKGGYLIGNYVKEDGGEYVIRRPNGNLAVLSTKEVDWVHPIHATISPRQLKR